MAKKLKGAAVLRAAAVFPLLACVTLPGASAFAQTPARAMGTAPRAVRALLVSDIHFEPFWDPAKAAQLNAAPARGWKAILWLRRILPAAHSVSASLPRAAGSAAWIRREGGAPGKIICKHDGVLFSPVPKCEGPGAPTI